ncbi:hypothetical protein [Achromobacter arsenitoxydans]|uniref:hypothetical protein n=1 Tax=Achromobacter arsenitoxydans TaxID=1147684 RepID=UPI001111B39F|nr:hypothetical protein [Achromobacter arsenitoxydans]
MQVDQVRSRPYPKWLLKFALKRALARPSPDHIPTAPISRLASRDYATTYIDGASEERYWLVDAIQGDSVQLRDLEKLGEPVHGDAQLQDLRRSNFRVIRYFKHLEWQFDSLYRYALFSVFGMVRLRLALDGLLQQIANRASLPTLERIHALQVAVDRASRGERHLTLRHILPIKGRQHRHPQLLAAFQFHQFVLDSLVASGEITPNSHDLGRYEITPQALVTLDQYRREERRIKAQAHAALWTAVGAAIVGAVVTAILALKN